MTKRPLITPQKEAAFICGGCNRVFKSQRALSMHLFHSDLVCKESIQTARALAAGASSVCPAPVVPPQKEATFICGGCNRFFISSHALGVHLSLPANLCKERIQTARTLAAGASSVCPTLVVPPAPSPSSKAGEQLFEEMRQDSASDMLAHFRFDKLHSGAAIQDFKAGLGPLLDVVAGELQRRLVTGQLHSVSSQAQIEEMFDVFKGLSTEKQEAAVMRQRFGSTIIQPVRRELGTRTMEVKDAEGFVQSTHTVTDACYDVPVSATVARLLQHNPEALRQVRETSRQWARNPPPHGTSDVVYADITDGQAFRQHPHFMQPSTDDEEASTLRIAFLLYYDGITTTNMLSGSGQHSIGVFLYTLINLSPDVRTALPFIQVATIALEADVKRYGAHVVVGGEGDAAGSSFGAQLRSFDKGVMIDLPAARGGYVSTKCCGWLAQVHADYPAAQSLSPFKESTAADRFDRASNVDSSAEGYGKPSSYVRQGEGINTFWELRDRAGVLALIQSALTMQGGLAAQRKYLSKHGLRADKCGPGFGPGSHWWALHSFYFPGFDSIIAQPSDMMHMREEGILKLECAAMLYLATRKKGRAWFTLSDVNAAILTYPWPPGERPITITETTLQGSHGVPDQGIHLRFTAAQTLHFTIHSINLLQPLLSVEARQDPVWLSWVACVDMTVMMQRSQFSEADVLELDRRIYHHQTLFCLVPEYKLLWKPKHQFAQLAPAQIRMNGPLRSTSCMRFEAKLQDIKAIANCSNYINICLCITRTWGIRSGRDLYSQKMIKWSAPTFTAATEGCLVTVDNADRTVAWVMRSLDLALVELTELTSLVDKKLLYTPGTTWVIWSCSGGREDLAAVQPLSLVERLFQLDDCGIPQEHGRRIRNLTFVVLRVYQLNLQQTTGDALTLSKAALMEARANPVRDELVTLDSLSWSPFHMFVGQESVTFQPVQ